MTLVWKPVYYDKRHERLNYVQIILFGYSSEICYMYADGRRTYHRYVKEDEIFPWE